MASCCHETGRCKSHLTYSRLYFHDDSMTSQLDSHSGQSRSDSSRVQRAIDRAVDWTLDHNGDMYGDERERLRWYEGIALGASMQWIAIPWLLAVMAWICSRETAPYLWGFMAVSVLPQYLTLFYVSRKRVDVTNIHWTRKRIIITALTIVPLLAFVVGLTVGLDLRSDGEVPTEALAGGGLGAIIGMSLVGVVVVAKRRAAEKRRLAEEHDDRVSSRDHSNGLS
jgi:hypothetical protein